jgi:hypothetical protein
MKIIGLVGPMGSGKSVVAKIIEDYGYKRVRFSAPLKNMFRAIGLDDKHIEGRLKEKPCDLLSGATPRHCMQTLGTEWARDMIAKNFWTNLWKAEVEKHNTNSFLRGGSGGKVVAEDCRFPNEAIAIKQMGGEIWAVKRNGYGYSGHSSETEMAEIQATKTVLNNGTIGDLYRCVGMHLTGINTDNNDVSADLLWKKNE